MDIRRKMDIVEQAVRSISTHDDADSGVISAALDKVAAMIEEQRRTMFERKNLGVQALDQPPRPVPPAAPAPTPRAPAAAKKAAKKAAPAAKTRGR